MRLGDDINQERGGRRGDDMHSASLTIDAISKMCTSKALSAPAGHVYPCGR